MLIIFRSLLQSNYFLCRALYTVVFTVIAICMTSCVAISTKKFTYTEKDIVPVYEWEITAELIAYDEARDIDPDDLEQESNYRLEVRTSTIDKLDRQLPLDSVHDLRIDSVIVSYDNVVNTYLGHKLFEDNHANTRSFNKNGQYLGRLAAGRFSKKVGNIFPDINEVAVSVYVTTRNQIYGEESFVRKINLKFYKNRSKWPKILEGK